MIGKTVAGNFRIVKLIGSGAMGNVYQCEQLSLGKMVAIKLLHRELMADEKLIKRFELEAKNASSLNHPNSIQIIDFGRDGEFLFIAMELLPGRDLAQVISRESPLSLARVVRIMDQVLAALDEAHAQGIVHRDLKPSNIMLLSRRGDPDFVKVCDFGIAKAQTSREGAMLTMKGLVCGTPEYMSPEQARGEEVDGRSDLYASAVLLYQLVTGDLPFTASSPVGILSKHLVERPQAPSVRRRELNIPIALESLILRGLEKNPADRPQTAAIFRGELRIACPITGTTPSPVVTNYSSTYSGAAAAAPSTAVMKPKRNWMATVFATLGVVGAAAAAYFLLAQPSTPPAPAPEKAATGTAGQVTVTPPPHIETLAPVPKPSAPPAAETPPPENLGTEEAPSATKGSETAKDLAKRSAHKAPVKTVAVRNVGRQAGRNAEANAHSSAAPSTAAQATDTAPAAQAAAAPAAPAPSSPPSAGREGLAEAERLMAQGEVASACAKAEEAKRAGAHQAGIFRFLGKCYNRIGDVEHSTENYRKYLEISPNAPEKAFIQSMLK